MTSLSPWLVLFSWVNSKSPPKQFSRESASESFGYTEGLLLAFPTVALTLGCVDVILQHLHSTATLLGRHGEWAVPTHGEDGRSFSKWGNHGRRNKYTISSEKSNHVWAGGVWLYKFTWRGKGRGGRVAWEIQDGSTACGSYATSGSDFSMLQDMFTRRSTYLPMLHMMTLQADTLAAPEKGGCGQTAQIHLVKTC